METALAYPVWLRALAVLTAGIVEETLFRGFADTTTNIALGHALEPLARKLTLARRSSARALGRKTAASTYSHEEQHDDLFRTYLPLVP